MASFTPSSGQTLDAAARDCGFTGFDWVQRITQWPSPNSLFAFDDPATPIAIVPPQTAIYDPPPRGYTYSESQTPPFLGAYPFVYNPVYVPTVCAQTNPTTGNCILHITEGNTLNFSMPPTHPAFPAACGRGRGSSTCSRKPNAHA